MGFIPDTSSNDLIDLFVIPMRFHDMNLLSLFQVKTLAPCGGDDKRSKLVVVVVLNDPSAILVGHSTRQSNRRYPLLFQCFFKGSYATVDVV